MNFTKYQHIEKLGSVETEGILNGTCYLTYKIDGTNGSIWLGDDNELHFGSRNRELSLNKDNGNFMNLMTKNADLCEELKLFLRKYPKHIIYGEWLVPVTIKRYKLEAQKKFYVFDIFDTETGKYVSYDDYSVMFDYIYTNINYIPLIAKLENPTEEEVRKYLDQTGKFLITEGLGEGIVIKNYQFVNKFGRTTWAKVLTEDFLKTKQVHRQENRENKLENMVEYKISNLLTTEHISKEKSKLLENKGTEWSDKYIFELMNRVYFEFLHDNLDIILKKFHNPTINFSIVRKLTDKKVKDTLDII